MRDELMRASADPVEEAEESVRLFAGKVLPRDSGITWASMRGGKRLPGLCFTNIQGFESR